MKNLLVEYLSEKYLIFFAEKKKRFTFASPFKKNAKIAQLVEHDLAKVGVAGSSPVFRSSSLHKKTI